MPLDQTQIDALNILAEMTPEVQASRPDLFSEMRAYVDGMRMSYPDVCDDDLAAFMMDNATGLAYVLASTSMATLPSAMLNLITMWGQAAVELSKLTRGS